MNSLPRKDPKDTRGSASLTGTMLASGSPSVFILASSFPSFLTYKFIYFHFLLSLSLSHFLLNQEGKKASVGEEASFSSLLDKMPRFPVKGDFK